MVANIITGAVIGIEGHKIVVEVDISNALPGMAIVGLPDAAVSEAKERIRSAIKNSGYAFPTKKIVINLAPADIRKEGSGFDLPMAVGVLASNGELDEEKLIDTAFLGELSLNGNLRRINGILPTVLGLKNAGIKRVILPADNAYEAALVEDIDIYPAEHFSEVINFLRPDTVEEIKLKPFKVDIKKYLESNGQNQVIFDFKDVKGQQKAKRALEIAAAGAHNIINVALPVSSTSFSICSLNSFE